MNLDPETVVQAFAVQWADRGNRQSEIDNSVSGLFWCGEYDDPQAHVVAQAVLIAWDWFGVILVSGVAVAE